MAKKQLVKNNKGQFGLYDSSTKDFTPIKKGQVPFKKNGELVYQDGDTLVPFDVPDGFDVKANLGFRETARAQARDITPATEEMAAPAEEVKKKADMGLSGESVSSDGNANQQGGFKVESSPREIFGMDYSSLFKDYGNIGEIARDVVDVPANLTNAIYRGYLQGKAGANIVNNLYKFSYDELASTVKDAHKYKGSEYFQRQGDPNKSLIDDKTAAALGIAESALESIGGLVGSWKMALPGIASGAMIGAATGAATGLLGGPFAEVTVPAGAVEGAIAGARMGMAGASSYAREFGGVIESVLTQKGYNMEDPKQLKAAFENKEVMALAREEANSKAIPVALFDAFTAGIAPKAASVATNVRRSVLTKAGKELTRKGAVITAGSTALGIEMVGGMLGEATGQLNQEGKISDWDAIILEGLGELGPGAGSAIYAGYRSSMINSQENQANLTKIESLKAAAEQQEPNTIGKKVIDDKISKLEEENRNRNNSVTTAMQTAPVSTVVRVNELTNNITDLEAQLDKMKEGTIDNVSAEQRTTMFDALNDMIAERDELVTEMKKASAAEQKAMGVPDSPMKPVVNLINNKESVAPNTSFTLSENTKLFIQPTDKTVMFSPDFKEGVEGTQATVSEVRQGNDKIGTILEYANEDGSKSFTVAETGKSFETADEAKFSIQEKLSGMRVSELEKTGVDRIKVEGNLARTNIEMTNEDGTKTPVSNELKASVQRAVRALRSVSGMPVYLYTSTDSFTKGIENSSGGTITEDNRTKAQSARGQLIDSNGKQSIHINLEKVGPTTVSHEVFHGSLVGLAKKNPQAFVAMRDSIINRLSDKKALKVTKADGTSTEVSPKEYLDNFQSRYSGKEFTEADRAEEFLGELAGIMGLSEKVIEDKTLVKGVMDTMKKTLSKVGITFDSLSELNDEEEMVDFFKSFNRSMKTGESLDVSKIAALENKAVKPINEVQDGKTNVSTQPATENVPEGRAEQGAKEKEKGKSVDESISSATTQEVKLRKSKGGNNKPKAKQAMRSTLFMDALTIEPTSPEIMALQYFISGGKVLRGSTKDNNEPVPKSLITLFTKRKPGGYYVTANKEMNLRLGLVDSKAPTIDGIANSIWENQQEEQFTTQEIANAVEEVLLGHISPTTMAKSLVENYGTPTQETLSDYNSLTAEMDDMEQARVKYEADKAGVSVEEFIKDPSKYMTDEEQQDSYDDWVSVFNIYDDIKDTEAVMAYMEDSAPDELFFDEIVAKVAKKETDLNGELSKLTAEKNTLNREKKRLAAAKDKEANKNQLSLVSGTQTELASDNLKSLIASIAKVDKRLAEVAEGIGKINSAIEFKERKTINAFAEPIATQAEKSNLSDNNNSLDEQKAEEKLREKEDLELLKLNEEVFNAKNKIGKSKDTESAIKNYNEAKDKRDNYEKSLNNRRQDLSDAKEIDSLIEEEIVDSKNSKYEYAKEFKIDPLLAALKRQEDMLEFIAGDEYVNFRVEKYGDLKEEAIKDQKNGVERYSKTVELLQSAIAEKSMKEEAIANLESNKEKSAVKQNTISVESAPSKAQAKIQAEIARIEEDSYSTEMVIEGYKDELEIIKGNLKDDKASLAEKKKEALSKKMSKSEREDVVDEYDSMLEDLKNDYDDEVDSIKDSIKEVESDIKRYKREIAKLQAKSKFQLSEGETVTAAFAADATYKYQMDGNWQAIEFVDKIREKYTMQSTAQKMGMLGKASRATEKFVSDNIVTRVLGGASAMVYKRFANERANTILGMPFAKIQEIFSKNVLKGVQSGNKAASTASSLATSIIQNLSATEDFQANRNKLVGGKSIAKNEMWVFGQQLNGMIGDDKNSLRRVHSLLDPEAFENNFDENLPLDVSELSFNETRLYNVLRDMNDYIHEWHYRNGFFGEGVKADAMYEKNKGSYFARMYSEIEDEKFGSLYEALQKLPNGADFTMFKQRQDFDAVANLTLKEDPIYITTKRFGQMMQNQAILQFCDFVSKSKDYKVYNDIEDVPEGAYYRLLAGSKDGGKRYGALTGKYVPDIVAQQLRGIEFSNKIMNDAYELSKLYDKNIVRQALSKKLTTWNPLTRTGNILMNFVFATMAGVDPITLLKNRPAAKEGMDSYDADVRFLDANGLLGVTLANELTKTEDLSRGKKIVSDVVDSIKSKKKLDSVAEQAEQDELDSSEEVINEAKESLSKNLWAKAKTGATKTKQTISNLDDVFTSSYGKSDDVAKVALFKSLVNDYGYSREAALKTVASSMQNYNTVGKAYDAASKTTERFIKFKADSARILYNTFKSRPLNLMATLGSFMAMQALFSSLSGEDEDERKIREGRPGIPKLKLGPLNLSFVLKTGDYEINVARYLAPYSVYDSQYNDAAPSPIAAFAPFMVDRNTVIRVNDPFVGPVVQLITDKDFQIKPIGDPGVNKFVGQTVTDSEIRLNQLAFLGRNYGAPYYSWIENAVKASSGEKDFYGRERSVGAAALNAVIKTQKVDSDILTKQYEGISRKLVSEYQGINNNISNKRKSIGRLIDEKRESGADRDDLKKYILKNDETLNKFIDEQLEKRAEKEAQITEVNKTIEKLRIISRRKP